MNWSKKIAIAALLRIARRWKIVSRASTRRSCSPSSPLGSAMQRMALQWAHTTRAYCASVAPAPCAPSLTVIVSSSALELGYRVAITFKHSGDAAPIGTLILYSDKVDTNIFQGAILQYDPCGLDSGDITVQGRGNDQATIGSSFLVSSEQLKVDRFNCALVRPVGFAVFTKRIRIEFAFHLPNRIQISDCDCL